jgi:hypothetical protein
VPINDHDGRSPPRHARFAQEGPRSRMSVQELTDRVRRGTYEVDETEVADAMLRRPGVRRLLLGAGPSDGVLEPGE